MPPRCSAEETSNTDNKIGIYHSKICKIKSNSSLIRFNKVPKDFLTETNFEIFLINRKPIFL